MCWVYKDDKDYDDADGNGESEDDANGVDADEVDQEGHEASIFTIAFSPNGKLLVTGGQDGFCRSGIHHPFDIAAGKSLDDA